MVYVLQCNFALLSVHQENSADIALCIDFMSLFSDFLYHLHVFFQIPLVSDILFFSELTIHLWLYEVLR